MWWRRERDLEAWSQRMRTHGRVEFAPRRWLAALIAAFGLLLGLAGVAGLGTAPDSTSGTVALAFLAVFGLVTGALTLRLAMRSGPVLVADKRGIHLPDLDHELPWRAVRAVQVVRVRLVPILHVVLERRFKDDLLRDSPAAWRAVHALDDTVTLPFPIAADVDHLADWLSREARRRS